MNLRQAGLAGGLLALGALGYFGWSHKPGPSASWTLTGNALQGSLGETVTFARATGTECLLEDGGTLLPDGGVALWVDAGVPCISAAGYLARDGDYAATTNKLPDGGAAWCVGADYKPYAAFASLPSEQGLLQIGLPSSSTNIIQFSIDTTSGKPKLVVYDSTGATKQVLADSAISAARHRLFGCSNSGTLTLWVDGVLVAGTSSGTGTGTVAIQQSTVYLGSLALADGGATNQAQGWLSNVVLIPQGTPQ